MEKKRTYESPYIYKTQVKTESSFCAGSEVEIEKSPKHNVEVDDYATIENDVIFE